MDILPKQYKDFLDKQYWDKFFEQIKHKNNQQFFEWYGSFSDLKKIFTKLILPQQKILNIGCGKSLLSEELNDSIGCNVVSCDYSQKVIGEMQARVKTQEKGIKYEVVDVFDLQYEGESFDVVLDKGTLDAVFPENNEENKQRIEGKMFPKILQILKHQAGSKYIIISMLQQHIMNLIFQYFAKQNCQIKIYQQAIDSASLHPFLISIEYATEPSKQIELNCLNGEIIKSVVQEISKQIKNIQIKSQFAQKMNILKQDQRFSLNIYDKNRQVRFVLEVLDSSVVKVLNKNKCGVFIVPQGKQTTFLYGTQQGLQMVQEQVGMSRLIVVKLVSGNVYDSLESTKKQLNSIIPKVLPKGCSPNDVPYMTDSDELGEREYIYKDKQHIVQDVKIDDIYYRRLIIHENRGMIQSQYRLSYFNQKNPLKQHLKNTQNLKTIMPKKKGTLIGLDLEELDQGYERAVVGGLMLLPEQTIESAKVLMLGGGGCVIPNFLANAYKQIDITVVEIDKKIIEIAKQFFEVNQSQKYKLVNADALKFIAEAKNTQYDIIIFDINGREGEPSPSKVFLTEQFLANLKKLLSPSGLLIFHMINNQIPQAFKSLFNPINIWNDGLVDVLFCFNEPLMKTVDPVSKKQIIVTKSNKIVSQSKKRWAWQLETFEGIKVYWPKKGGVFEGAEIFVEEKNELQNSMQEQMKEDIEKVNKKKKNKKK